MCIFLAISIITIYFTILKKFNINSATWYISSIWFIPLTFRVLRSASALRYSKEFNLRVEIR